MSARPTFSIVIPVYNREREVRRAIESCLAEGGEELELVVVDDASTDGTIEAVKAFRDPRIKLIVHDTNRGECPARNTGVRHSQGVWVLLLDSDHALLPGSLARLKKYVEQAPPSVHRLGFLYAWDDGRLSPYPVPGEKLLDYLGYLDWVENATFWDMFLCTRRTTFERVLMPDSLVDPMEYHLDFSRQFNTYFRPEALATQFTDADNRLTGASWRPSEVRRLKRALDDIESRQNVLRRHGDVLKARFPRTLERVRRDIALAHIFGDRPHRELANALREYLKCRPSLFGLPSVILATVHPGFYLSLRELKRRCLPGSPRVSSGQSA